MTDKQIIIDGVDVVGCGFYNKDDKTCREVNGKYDTDICEFDKCENSDCYYKQLKRKEQECYEYIKELTRFQQEVVPKLRKRLRDKEQECEELKRYLNQIRDEELSHLDIEWDEYQTCNRQTDYSNIVTLVERALGEIDD